MTITTNIHGNPDLAFITDFMGGRPMIRLLVDVPEPAPVEDDPDDKQQERTAKANAFKSRMRTYKESLTWMEAFATEPNVEAVRVTDLAVAIIADQCSLTMRGQGKTEHQWLRAMDGRRIVVEIDGNKIRFTAGDVLRAAKPLEDYDMMGIEPLVQELKSRGIRLITNGETVFEPGHTSPIQKYRLIEMLRANDAQRALAGRNLRLA
jgi:hypothetical protein